MPTRPELLREAAEKETLAAAFMRYARGLSDVFAGIPSKPADVGPYWMGPAAQRYLTQALRLRHEMDELEDSCVATAENLRHRAGRLREEAAQCGPTSDDNRWAR
ncbi:hypothetical protein [Nonomuraea insulae]|uniref:Excreted virulence factor EspC (Type VII ESX diderm) n=1 Tax=Nonomuraea insulae TaxID=1616787 RepID=A0ABW1CFS6_9ACTN